MMSLIFWVYIIAILAIITLLFALFLPQTIIAIIFIEDGASKPEQVGVGERVAAEAAVGGLGELADIGEDASYVLRGGFSEIIQSTYRQKIIKCKELAVSSQFWPTRLVPVSTAGLSGGCTRCPL